MIRRAAALLICAVLAALCLLPACALTEENHQKVVRVGWYETPFNHKDAFGRRTRSEDVSVPPGGLSGTGLLGGWTLTAASIAGVASPLSNAVETAYSSGGHDVLTEGDGSLPTLRQTDAFGRLASISTSRDGSLWDTTVFSRDAATGLPVARTYADGSAVTNAYAAQNVQA